MQYWFNAIKQSIRKEKLKMTIIIKDNQGNVIIEKNLDATEYTIDLVENADGQIQCSIQQVIASIH